jgi:hypothetical protein
VKNVLMKNRKIKAGAESFLLVLAGFFLVGVGGATVVGGVEVIPAPEITLTGNGQEVFDGAVTADPGNHTAFGSTPVTGGTVVRTFTIRNDGGQVLSLSGTPRVHLGSVVDFTVTTQPAATVAVSGGTTTFTITYNPTTRGNHSTIVTIANNDDGENPFTFVITGTGTAPEITLKGNNAEINAGDTTPSATDHTLFGSIGAAMQRTFTITNEGNQNLLLNGSPLVTLSGSAAFEVGAQPGSATLATEGESATTTFQIVFDPALLAGVQTATVSIANNDANEAPYTFTIRGNGLTQLAATTFRSVIGNGRIDLAVFTGASPTGGVFSGPGVVGGFFNPDGLAPGAYALIYSVADAIGQTLESEITVTVDQRPARLRVGNPRSFATTTVGAKSSPQSIVIENNGGADATSVRVVLRGKSKKYFQINQPAPTIKGGGSETFRVTFTPRSGGAHKAKAVILSSAGPVTITLSGRGKVRGGNGHLPGG